MTSTAPPDALVDLAIEAQGRAFAKYSGFQVGCAMQTADGEVRLGCNVENISYGLTNCAERVAIGALIADGNSPADVEIIVVVGPDLTDCSPCGACRQVLAELTPDAQVWFRSNADWAMMRARALLPHAFDSDLVKTDGSV